MAGFHKGEQCLICGENLYSSENLVSRQCIFCGEFFYTNLVCENGHHVCDECQMERALETITHICLKSKKREVVAIAYELMTNKWIKMHGPEHYFLVAAVLLTSYKNRGYNADMTKWAFESMLEEARKRAVKIPANSCGYWGCAGEAIGCGIFASLILKVSPMSVRERGSANMITSKALEQIAMHGGPRCSKRDSLTAILTASQFAEANWNAPLTGFQGVECLFSDRNPDCTKARCPYYPKPESEGDR